MFKWLEKAYFWCLWFWGFSDTDGNINTPNDREKITFMLRRSKERMGIWWWILSLTTLLGVWTLCLLVSWWFIPLEAFLLWLFVHVLYAYKPPDNIWKPD
jgi:CHASE2 domain-containing sensor protein